MSNASRAPAATSEERPPPVLGSCLPLGIVSRITSSLGEVVSPPYWMVAAPVLAPLLVAVLSSVVEPVCAPVVPVVVSFVGVVLVSVVSVVPVVVPVVLVPVVPVVLVYVVCCPHAGNANTKRKVRAANIVRKYGTDFPLLVIYLTNPLTIAYRCKQCNFLGRRDVAAPSAAAPGIRTFANTSIATHLDE